MWGSVFLLSGMAPGLCVVVYNVGLYCGCVWGGTLIVLRSWLLCGGYGWLRGVHCVFGWKCVCVFVPSM